MTRALDTRKLKCPATGKSAFVDEERALRALQSLWEDEHGTHDARHGAMPRKVYRCPECGWWHLSHLGDHERRSAPE